MFGKKVAQKDPDSDLAVAIDASNRHNAENTRILTMLAQDYLKERKSRRRWGWFFKGLIAVYIGFTLFAWFHTRDTTITDSHTALVELEGLIAPGSTNADEINDSLRRAFKAESSVGVVLRINSPGGTPVQAASINSEIQRLKNKYPDKPFYVVITDVCASGGYYVAVAADEIYAHPSSIVGSIGVRMDAFGFVGTMNKLGVERRLITAGENKGMLDPFSPVEPGQVVHAETMLNEVHQQFIEAVKKGRGDRLMSNEDIFSGLFWSGERARELGLVDKFGGLGEIARDVLGADRVVTYNPKRSLLDEFARNVGSALSARLLEYGFQLR